MRPCALAQAMVAFFEQWHGAPSFMLAAGQHRDWRGLVHFSVDGKVWRVDDVRGGSKVRRRQDSSGNPGTK